MILYIAEKPSQGRAIAAALPKPHRSGDGFIQVGDDYVSWCIGHLLEQAEPDAYDPAFKQWQLQHLPIVPSQWQLQPKPKTRKQLSVLRKLVKQADQLVHAGDPDREGQLLVDELIGYLGVSAEKQRRTQRLLVNDLNPSAIKRSLAALRENRDFIPLSVSALARSRADWLYGINLTRAYTLQGRKVGYQGVLSVGRVQTPLLGLVVRRDLTIEQFVSKPFFEVWAELATAEGDSFNAKWQPSEACQRYQDDEGRVLSRPLAENVLQRIKQKSARVVRVNKTLKRRLPPLPYNLSALQIDAGKRYGMSAQQVLDGCQALYERHTLITYPRSDCRYLPVEHHAQAAAVIGAIVANAAELGSAAKEADLGLKSKAWNDARVDAHHAIIPSQKRTDLSRLSRQQQQLYSLIARQYLCQFYPPYQYHETEIEVEIEGGRFIAKAQQIQQQGWQVLFEKTRPDAEQRPSAKAADRVDPRTQLPVIQLPAIQQGQQLACTGGRLDEKQTQPPAYFTDASLLAAMTGIARFVTAPEIRKVLKDTDGLGTEATRAGIIELLFKRHFLARQGKQIRSTPAGRGLIDCLPEQATTPDMTAQWEATLEAISQRQANYEGFMQPLISTLQSLLESAKQTLPSGLSGLPTETKSKPRRRPSKARTLKHSPKSQPNAKPGRKTKTKG